MKKSAKRKSENNKKIWVSALGIVSGALAAGTYYILKNDKDHKILSKKTKDRSIKDLQAIVEKSKTGVEDILRKMNTEVSKVSSNGKAKVEKMF